MRLKSQNGATQHEGKVTSQTSKSRIQGKKGGCNESDQKPSNPSLALPIIQFGCIKQESTKLQINGIILLCIFQTMISATGC